MSNRIKVVGYAKKVTYVDGIEYRDFTPDLVGNQLTSNGGSPLFTLGNFAITTNLDPKLDKTYNSAKFSNFITLSDINLTLNEANTLLADNAEVVLNLDKRNLDYYALFGSLSEYIRVSLETIITQWPASLYLDTLTQNTAGQTIFGQTVDDYTYDSISNISSFKVNTSFINNKFGIVYTTNGTIINTFNQTNDLRNLTINFNAYSVLYNDIEYPLVGFSASTNVLNDYIYLNVTGNPFTGSQSTYYVKYHIKPSKIYEDKFFNTLLDLEAYLLNRMVVPKYTASFKYPVTSDDGIIMYITNSVTWPVSDGYNIDFDTDAYVDYVTSLLDIAAKNDLFSSNLMNRFLVSESITAFDTMPVHLSDLQQDTSGQKVNKTLQIYGREFDELNRYILGIQFANTVTYDKQNNTPDVYLKNLARVLGWELVSSVFDNNLLASYVSTTPSTYSGQSVGLTAVEADIELWRRIILNTPWIWKSKGARKVIEFFLRFIGAPLGLIQFNEYIYKADAPINMDIFFDVLRLNGLDTDISLYPIDTEGYPRFFQNTDDMYFQNNGLWYRETGGSGSTIEILTGNNPHVGPYDGGYKYFNQLRCLIPDFLPVTLSSVTYTTDVANLYTNFDLGQFNFGVTTATTVTSVDITNSDGTDIDDCIIFRPSIIPDPNPSPELNDCGCDIPNSDNVMSLCIDKVNPIAQRCDVVEIPAEVNPDVNVVGSSMIFGYKQYDINGNLLVNYFGQPILNQSKYISQECCLFLGGEPFFYEYKDLNNNVINSGYVCCKNERCKKIYDTQIVNPQIINPQNIIGK